MNRIAKAMIARYPIRRVSVKPAITLSNMAAWNNILMSINFVPAAVDGVYRSSTFTDFLRNRPNV